MWVINMTHLKVVMKLEFDYRKLQIFARVTQPNFKIFDLT